MNILQSNNTLRYIVAAIASRISRMNTMPISITRTIMLHNPLV